MQNGEKGQIRVRMSTIGVVPPPPLPVAPVPTPTPVATATGTPTPTPTPAADPDLVITELGSISMTVTNQGSAAAGPFDVTATGYPAMHSEGLAAGASQTFKSGTGCNGGAVHAVVDPGNLVRESDEDNNTADAQQIC